MGKWINWKNLIVFLIPFALVGGIFVVPISLIHIYTQFIWIVIIGVSAFFIIRKILRGWLPVPFQFKNS